MRPWVIEAMTRSQKFQAAYLAVLLVIGGAVATAIWYFDPGAQALFVLVVALLIPGRIPSFFWSQFYAGTRLLQAGDYREAIERFESFLTEVKQKSWLKKLMLLKWGRHTWDIEAMTLNNLGSAFLEMGELDRAGQTFEAATRIDEQYAIAHFNLALVRYAQGATEAARSLYERAHELGYPKMSFGAFAEKAGRIKDRSQRS
jgi:tetratricopeptide (TPR) repeat protein